jgi:hypothetical protein
MNDAHDPVAIGRRIVRLNAAYTQSKVLQSAAAVGVFDLLADGPATEPEIRERLGLHARLSGDFLDTLVCLGLLDRTDAGQYLNSAAATEHLVAGDAHYLGGGLLRAEHHDYAMWGRLTEALRDGLAKAEDPEVEDPDRNLPARTRRLEYRDGSAEAIGASVARRLDWLRYSDFVEVGGADGTVAAQVVAVHTHLRGVVFDLPELRPRFAEYIGKRGLEERIGFHPGSWLWDPFPPADVFVLGRVLNHCSVDARQRLLGKAYDAVRPGGALLVYDQLVDDDRRDLFSLLLSLNVKLSSVDAAEYTVRDLRESTRKAGFDVERVVDLDAPGEDKVFIARKQD